MSKDFIVFDLSGTKPIPEAENLLDAIHDLVGEGKPNANTLATEKIEEIVLWASQKYGSEVGSQWAYWPPSILAAGRHCTFGLSLKADAITFMILLSDQCKRLGLVMIDPSGKNPFITIPGGGGILD